METVAEKFTESGIAPLELVKYGVLSCKDKSRQGIFTELRINSLELGALCPAQYRVVTNRNSQSIRLATWAFRRTLPMLSELKGNGWISFYIPAKMLMRDNLKKLLQNEHKKGITDFKGLVAEVSSEILYENAEQAAAKMNELRQEYGIRFLLSEFGDEYCPVLRLPLYPVDFVLLDSALGNEGDFKTSAAATVNLAKQNGIKVIARLNRPLSGDSAPDYYMSEHLAERGDS